MAIVVERLEINGIDYTYTKSDAGRYICRDGYQFEDAYDKVSFGRTYTEGDVIPNEPDYDELADKAEAYDILMGVQK